MKRSIWIVVSLILLIGCYDEETLTPSSIKEFKYSVPQGNHDYDAKIVDWFEKGGFYILYKFNPQDIYFDVTVWQESLTDPITGEPMDSKIRGQIATEEYVGKQLKLLGETCLNFYSDIAMKKWLPMKFLLCSDLKYYGWGYVEDYAMSSCFDNISINYGSEKIEEILTNQEAKIEFKNNINQIIFTKVKNKNLISVPEEFEMLSEYGNSVSRDEMYALGFIKPSDWKQIMTAKIDWYNFIEAIRTTPYQDLIAENEDVSSNIGILNPVKDVNGLIRKKYDALTKYFKDTYQMDLQTMGNYLQEKQE